MNGIQLVQALRADDKLRHAIVFVLSTSRRAEDKIDSRVGLTEVLRAAGLVPDAVFGHSVGEVAAAWASGALSLEQATAVIHHRSAAQGTTAGLGRMAALGIGPNEAKRLMAEASSPKNLGAKKTRKRA